MRRLPVVLPRVLAFVLGVGLVASIVLCPSIAAEAEGYHRVFSGAFCAVRFFSPTNGLAVTTNGLLVTDGSPNKWKGVAGWDRTDDIRYYAGGDEKTVYLVTSSCKDVVVGDAVDATKRPPGGFSFSREGRRGKIVWVRHDYTWTLVRWTASAGFENVRTIPSSVYEPTSPAKCTFVNADTGAFGDARQVYVTRDAGKTWISTEVFEKPYGILDVLWTDPTHLIIAQYFHGIVVGLELDAGNRAREKWRTELRKGIAIYFPEPLKLSPDGKTLWVYTDYGSAGWPRKLHAINPANGKELRTDWPLDELRTMRDAVRETAPHVIKGEALNGFVPTNTNLYVWGSYLDGGGGFTAAYDLATKKIVGTATIERNADEIQAVIRVSDHSAFLVIGRVGQIVPWDERSVELPAKFVQPWSIKNLPGPVVDNKLLDEAEERRPGTDERPSRREIREWAEAQKAVGFNRRLEIVQEREVGDFDNYRQYLLWITERYRKAAGTDSAAPPAAPAAPPASSPPIPLPQGRGETIKNGSPPAPAR